jgi:hypothetical protein
MRESNTQVDHGIRQGFCDGRQSMGRDGFGPSSNVVTAPLPAVEPLLDCAALPLSSGAFIRRPSSVGHERDAYPPIIISGIGNFALLSWKSGCSLM